MKPILQNPAVLLLGWLALSPLSTAAPTLSHHQSAGEVDAYDFVELTVKVEGTTMGNPFTETSLTGSFQIEGGTPISVEGFCDSENGDTHRIRFMPAKPGNYTYSATYQEGSFAQTFTGVFKARDAKRKGIVRVDKHHPFHFIWEGTGQRYFWNSTTAYWLLGWEDENMIKAIVERFAKLKVNRLRVALCGRTQSGERWHEPQVQATEQFKFRLNPWVAARPDSPDDPGFEVRRFNIPHWRKCERLLELARQHDIVISLIFFLDGKDAGVDPFGKEHAGSDDEKRYYSYAAARLSAYSNVMWDISNEYRLLRDDYWANAMGEYLKKCDPYHHLTSIHGHHDFHFRTCDWADFCSYQMWDEHGGYAFMLKNRQEQLATQKPKPQVNEEYGYEDHYPKGWGEDRVAPARDAASRRRLAWEISFAGAYQTTGERADRGTGRAPDTGGGWINGRGDDSMTLLQFHAHMADFFCSFDWWKTEPRPDLVKDSPGVLCLAHPGKIYAFYLPKGGTVKFQPDAGDYSASWCNPRTGEKIPLEDLKGGADWTSPKAPDEQDWALLVLRK